MTGLKDQIRTRWSLDAANYNRSTQSTWNSRRAKSAWESIFKDLLGTDVQLVLDVGTGPGFIAFLLAELGKKVVGIDLSEDMIKIANRNAKELGFNVDFKVSDAENLPFDDESFDAVVNRHVLWTLPNPERATHEWKRVLRPGGTLIIIDGNWNYNYKNSINKKIWRYLAAPIVIVTEKRIPRKTKLDQDIKQKLWSSGNSRPGDDIKILKKLGFRNVEVDPNINKRTQSLLDYIKLGYWGDTFLVTGVK
ncbi:MAG: class I SAM-dependent methyltransferase [Methanothrix sp.]|nr:MAG: class I SAM-dependent methyltransferase [Methanothrix sp.]